MGFTIGVLPQALHVLPRERLAGTLFHPVAEGARDRTGETLGALGQRVAEGALDVDVRVELVGQVLRYPVADDRALEQLAAGGGPVRGVEDLPVDPDGHDRGER